MLRFNLTLLLFVTSGLLLAAPHDGHVDRLVAGEFTSVTLHIPEVPGQPFEMFVADEFGVPVSAETSISLEWIPDGTSTITYEPTAGPGNFLIIPQFESDTSRSLICEVILPDGRSDVVAFGDVATVAGSAKAESDTGSAIQTQSLPLLVIILLAALILYSSFTLFQWWRVSGPIPSTRSTKIMLMIVVPLMALLPIITEKIIQVPTSQAVGSLAAEQRNSSAFATILGEFRLSASDMVFVKTERYMHNGVGFEPHLDMKEMQKSGEAVSKSPAELASAAPGVKGEEDPHAGHDHDHDAHAEEPETTSKLKTVIPQEKDDYRGWIGDLAREVKPFERPGDPHYHTKGTELLPWYRIATASNPQNIRMYTIGAWWLKSLNTPEQLNEALNFLNEGIRNNPNGFELVLMRGFIYRELLQHEEAHASFMRGAELAKLIYVKEAGNPELWDDTRIEQAWAACTMSILMVRDEQGTQTAARLAESFTSTFPSPNPLERILESLKQ